MKNSFKISVVALTLFSFMSMHSNAQTTSKPDNDGSGTRLSFGVDAGTPVGSLNGAYNWSLGGSIQADFPIVKNQFYVTVNTGFNNIFATSASQLSDIQLIPLKGGLKYFIAGSLYIQGEAGATFITDKVAIGADKSVVFVYAPQAGYIFNVGRNSYIDAGVRFEGNTRFVDGSDSNNFLALRAAYAFGL